MAVEHAQSSLVADGTEQDIGAAITNAGTFLLYVDLNNLINGDIVELRAKVKISSGGSYITLFNRSYAHDFGDPDVSEVLQVSVPITHIHGMKFTLHQVDGTNRTFPYQIIQLDAATPA
jgi:hypothetical protein